MDEPREQDGLDPESLETLRQLFEENIHFNRELGLEIDSMSTERAVLTFPFQEKLIGNFVRRALHGPITPQCPASLLRRHANATLTLANYVAEPPQIELR